MFYESEARVISKKEREYLQRALGYLERSVQSMESPEVLGYAVPVKESMANGANYSIRNPECLKTCSGTSANVRVVSFVGSDMSMMVHSRNILRGMLSVKTQHSVEAEVIS